MKELLRNFCEVTAIHGFSLFVKIKTCVGRVSWLILVLIAFVFLVLHLTLLVEEYQKFNYIEKTTLTEKHIFPNVVCCPLGGNYPSDLYKYYSTQANKQYWELVQDQDNATLTQDLKYITKPQMKYANLNRQQGKYVEENATEVIVDAELPDAYTNINGSRKIIPNPMFRYCLMFTPQNWDRKGYHNGVHLVLYNQNTDDSVKTEYERKSIAGSYGFRITLTHHENPNVDDDGFGIKLGTATEVSVTQTDIERLESPYFQCTNYGKEVGGQQGCLYRCHHGEIVKRCGCRNVYSILYSMYPKVPFCQEWQLNYTKFTQSYNCYANAWNMANCNCDLSCFERKYRSTYSSTSWPMLSQTESFIKQYVKSGSSKFHSLTQYLKRYHNIELKVDNFGEDDYFERNNISTEILRTWIRKHFTQVSIFLSTESVQNIVSITFDTFSI